MKLSLEVGNIDRQTDRQREREKDSDLKEKRHNISLYYFKFGHAQVWKWRILPHKMEQIRSIISKHL
jgi:hypothetical protein